MVFFISWWVLALPRYRKYFDFIILFYSFQFYRSLQLFWQYFTGHLIYRSAKGWFTYWFSDAMRHNDARGWGYHKWRFEIQKNYRISKFMNCPELPMNYCVLVYPPRKKDHLIFTKLLNKFRNQSAIKTLRSYTKSVQFLSCYSPHIQAISLKKSSKTTATTTTTTTKHTHKRQDNGN